MKLNNVNFQNEHEDRPMGYSNLRRNPTPSKVKQDFIRTRMKLQDVTKQNLVNMRLNSLMSPVHQRLASPMSAERTDQKPFALNDRPIFMNNLNITILQNSKNVSFV